MSQTSVTQSWYNIEIKMLAEDENEAIAIAVTWRT